MRKARLFFANVRNGKFAIGEELLPAQSSGSLPILLKSYEFGEIKGKQFLLVEKPIEEYLGSVPRYDGEMIYIFKSNGDILQRMSTGDVIGGPEWIVKGAITTKGEVIESGESIAVIRTEGGPRTFLKKSLLPDETAIERQALGNYEVLKRSIPGGTLVKVEQNPISSLFFKALHYSRHRGAKADHANFVKNIKGWKTSGPVKGNTGNGNIPKNPQKIPQNIPKNPQVKFGGLSLEPQAQEGDSKQFGPNDQRRLTRGANGELRWMDADEYQKTMEARGGAAGSVPGIGKPALNFKPLQQAGEAPKKALQTEVRKFKAGEQIPYKGEPVTIKDHSDNIVAFEKKNGETGTFEASKYDQAGEQRQHENVHSENETKTAKETTPATEKETNQKPDIRFKPQAPGETYQREVEEIQKAAVETPEYKEFQKNLGEGWEQSGSSPFEFEKQATREVGNKTEINGRLRKIFNPETKDYTATWNDRSLKLSYKGEQYDLADVNGEEYTLKNGKDEKKISQYDLDDFAGKLTIDEDGNAFVSAQGKNLGELSRNDQITQSELMSAENIKVINDEIFGSIKTGDGAKIDDAMLGRVQRGITFFKHGNELGVLDGDKKSYIVRKSHTRRDIPSAKLNADERKVQGEVNRFKTAFQAGAARRADVGIAMARAEHGGSYVPSKKNLDADQYADVFDKYRRAGGDPEQFDYLIAESYKDPENWKADIHSLAEVMKAADGDRRREIEGFNAAASGGVLKAVPEEKPIQEYQYAAADILRKHKDSFLREETSKRMAANRELGKGAFEWGDTADVPATAKAVSNKIMKMRDSQNREYQAQYAIVPMTDVVQSHEASGKKNEDSPEELQARLREEAYSTGQMSKISQNINDDVVTDSADATRGAPAGFSKNGKVYILAGHGRSGGIKATTGEQRQKYFEMMKAKAAELGLPTDKLDENDMLVRVMTPAHTYRDARQLASFSQDSPAIPLSEVEHARAVQNANEEVLKFDNLNMEGIGNRSIDAGNIGTFVSSNPELYKQIVKQAGYTRESIEAHPEIQARVVNTALLSQLNKNFIEDVSRKGDRVHNLVSRIAPILADNQRQVEGGKLPKSANLQEFLAQTIKGYDSLDSGTKALLTIKNGQSDFLNDDVNNPDPKTLVHQMRQEDLLSTSGKEENRFRNPLNVIGLMAYHQAMNPRLDPGASEEQIGTKRNQAMMKFALGMRRYADAMKTLGEDQNDMFGATKSEAEKKRDMQERLIQIAERTLLEGKSFNSSESLTAEEKELSEAGTAMNVYKRMKTFGNSFGIDLAGEKGGMKKSLHWFISPLQREHSADRQEFRKEPNGKDIKTGLTFEGEPKSGNITKSIRFMDLFKNLFDQKPLEPAPGIKKEGPQHGERKQFGPKDLRMFDSNTGRWMDADDFESKYGQQQKPVVKFKGLTGSPEGQKSLSMRHAEDKNQVLQSAAKEGHEAYYGGKKVRVVEASDNMVAVDYNGQKKTVKKAELRNNYGNQVDKAKDFARVKHEGQYRIPVEMKIPYTKHTDDVCRILEEHGYGGDILAAAHLHDTLEDTKTTKQELKAEFGRKIAEIVEDVSYADPTASWKEKQEEYSKKLMRSTKSAAVVSIADKIANMRDMLSFTAEDYGKLFESSKDDAYKKYKNLLTIYKGRVPGEMYHEYSLLVETLGHDCYDQGEQRNVKARENLVSPDAKIGAFKLHTLAKQFKDDFGKAMQSVSDQVGIPFNAKMFDETGIKIHESIEKKIDLKKQEREEYSARQINDALRYTFEINDMDQAQKVLDAFKGLKEEHDIEIIKESVDNKFERPTVLGYRDLSFIVKVKGVITGEIQVNIPEIMEAKQGEGHDIYDKWKALNRSIASATDEEKIHVYKAMEKLQERSREIYAEALTKASSSRLNAGNVSKNSGSTSSESLGESLSNVKDATSKSSEVTALSKSAPTISFHFSSSYLRKSFKSFAASLGESLTGRNSRNSTPVSERFINRASNQGGSLIDVSMTLNDSEKNNISQMVKSQLNLFGGGERQAPMDMPKTGLNWNKMQGQEKPGHKYIRRFKGESGEWEYVYREASGREFTGDEKGKELPRHRNWKAGDKIHIGDKEGTLQEASDSIAVVKHGDGTTSTHKLSEVEHSKERQSRLWKEKGYDEGKWKSLIDEYEADLEEGAKTGKYELADSKLELQRKIKYAQEEKVGHEKVSEPKAEYKESPAPNRPAQSKVPVSSGSNGAGTSPKPEQYSTLKPPAFVIPKIAKKLGVTNADVTRGFTIFNAGDPRGEIESLGLKNKPIPQIKTIVGDLPQEGIQVAYKDNKTNEIYTHKGAHVDEHFQELLGKNADAFMKRIGGEVAGGYVNSKGDFFTGAREALESTYDKEQSSPLPEVKSQAKEPWETAKENIKPYESNLRALTDKELKAEDKSVSNAINKWANNTPTILPDGTLNPKIGRDPAYFDLSEKLAAIGREQESRSQTPPVQETRTTPKSEQAEPLTQKKSYITETPEFKKWFGDSKVVDKQGKPLKVFHGTNKSFNEFKGDWIYFSENNKYADAFADRLLEYKNGSVMPTYLSIKKPIDLRDVGISVQVSSILDRALREYGIDVASNLSSQSTYLNLRGNKKEITKQAKAKGYDGIVFNDEVGGIEGSSWIVFSPSQIKSAIGNKGTFDPNDKDITKSIRFDLLKGKVKEVMMQAADFEKEHFNLVDILRNGTKKQQEREAAEQAEELQRHLKDKIKAAEKETDKNPSEAQKIAGNYKKGKVKIQGLEITVENPKGSYRTGKDANGEEWKTLMNDTYGYFTRTEGKDGDEVDVFIGEHPESSKVFVLDQVEPDTKRFDEHKCLMGFESATSAIKGYKSNYADDASKRIGGIKEFTIDEFKTWLKEEDTTKRVSKAIRFDLFKDQKQMLNNVLNG